MIPIYSTTKKYPKAGRPAPKLAPYSAYLRGLMYGAKLLGADEARDVLSRCNTRAEKAFAVGALQRSSKILPEAALEVQLDVLCGPACHCEAQGLWHGVPRTRRRHAVGCPQWTAPPVGTVQ